MFQGMQTEQGRQHAERMRAAHSSLQQQWDGLHQQVTSIDVHWRGPDAEAFTQQWATVHAGGIEVLEHLQELVHELIEHAQQQDQSSAADDHWAGAAPGSTPGERRENGPPWIPGAAFNPGDGVTTMNDPAIQKAWEGMSDRERRAVLREVVKDELEAYGINARGWFPSVETRFFPGWMNGGAISLPTGVIYLSNDLLKSPYGLQIAAHEARHQVQYEMIRRTDPDPWDILTGDDNSDKYEQVERDYGFTREEIEQWRHEFEVWNYEFPPSGDPNNPEYQEQMQRYLDQQVEVNAREREDEFADVYTSEDLEQDMRDAGVR